MDWLLPLILGLLGGTGIAGLIGAVLAWKKDGRESQSDEVELVKAWRLEAAAATEDASEARKDAKAAREEVEGVREQGQRQLSALRSDLQDLERKVDGLAGESVAWKKLTLDIAQAVAAGLVPPFRGGALVIPPELAHVLTFDEFPPDHPRDTDPQE